MLLEQVPVLELAAKKVATPRSRRPCSRVCETGTRMSYSPSGDANEGLHLRECRNEVVRYAVRLHEDDVVEYTRWCIDELNQIVV